MAVLDDILSFNAARAGGGSKAVDAEKLCVVTCSEPGVLGLLGAALGIDPADATLITSVGPVVSEGGELLRGVGAALLLDDCNEVLVLAHSDCVLVTTDSGAAASALNRRGVDRGAIDADLRSFFGLSASPRQIAIDAAAVIRSQRWLPRGVPVHAAVMDAAGALTVIERGENLASAAPAGGSVEPRGPVALGSSLPSGLGVGLAAGSMLDGERGPQGSNGPVSMDYEPIQTAALDTSGFEMTQTVLKATQLEFGPSIEIKIEPVAPSRAEPIQLTQVSGGSTPLQTQVVGGPTAQPKPQPLPRSSPKQGIPPRPPPRRNAPAASKARPPARTPAFPQELLGAIEKVRGFYRGEMGTAVRSDVAQALGAAFGTGAANADLIKLTFKPILESGPKRYKVIDELLAIKEAASRMERDACYAALRQLVD